MARFRQAGERIRHERGADDIVHTDFHGVVVIPAEALRKLPDAIALSARREKVILDVCASADFSPAKLRAAAQRAEEIQ